MASSGSELEQRFGHLLKPIRDLASNWNIDIAQELEEYIDELEHVTVSFDGGKTSVNFAEAALVIQGSACVYSKKVEYLYALIYQTLDHLASQHKRSQIKSSVQADGTDADAMFDDEDGLLLLDDIIKPGKNIDMSEDGGVHGNGSQLGDAANGTPSGAYAFPDADRQAVRFTTPGNHINSAGALRAKTPLSVMGSFQCHTAARGTSFNLSHCAVHQSGALMLDGNNRSMMELSADLSHISVGGSPHGADAAMTPGPAPTAAPDNDLMFGGDDDNEGGGWEMAPASPPQEQQQLQQPRSSARPGARRVGFAPETVDVWATLDPYDVTAKPRPLRVGRTFRKPSDAASIARYGMAGRQADADNAQQTEAQVLDAMHTSRKTVSLVSSKPFFAALMPLKRAQQRRARAARRARLLAGEAEYTPAANVFDGDNDGDDGAGFDMFDGDDAIDGQPDPFDLQTGGSGMDMPDSHTDGMHLNKALDSSLAGAPTTYEELCRHHIEAFMRNADRFKEESGITKRVMDWQNRMEPILAAEEHRPAFDIHQYGARVMDTVQDVDEAGGSVPLADIMDNEEVAWEGVGDDGDEGEGDGGDDGSDVQGDASKHPARSVVEFEQVVDGMAPEEVCRVFLATLQLANSGNVRLVHEASLQQDAQEHHLRLMMLSTSPQVDMDKYLAPSATAHVTTGEQDTASGVGAGAGAGAGTSTTLTKSKPAQSKPTTAVAQKRRRSPRKKGDQSGKSENARLRPKRVRRTRGKEPAFLSVVQGN